MTAPRIVFRVDASTTIGFGHVARCLTLAEGVRARGWAAEFVCRDVEGHPAAWLRGCGFSVSWFTLDPAVWSWEADAAATRDAVGATAGDVEWLVVDHYGLDAHWEQALRPSARRVMVIDDMADRPHDADLLLDQNLVADAERRYDGKVSDACVRLIGPEWALLAPDYAVAHGRMPARVGRISRVLVSFGGADVDAVTTRVVNALLRLDRDDLVIDVVVPASSPQVSGLRALAANRPTVRVLTDVPSLVPMLAQADLSIGACGVTSWERLTMGVPSVVLTLAENQRPIAEELDRRGLVRWLGDGSSVSDAALDTAVADVVGTDLDEGWSLACLAAVDGRGLERTVATLVSDARTVLRARGAGPDDEARVLTWANDLGTRRTAFTRDPISPETHRGWFRRRLRDLDACEFSIIETLEGVPVGQVRFERQASDDWEVHYLVAPAFRGRGVGRNVLQAGLARFVEVRGVEPVFGRVQRENTASCRIFEALGFALVSAPDDATCTYVLKDVP